MAKQLLYIGQPVLVDNTVYFTSLLFDMLFKADVDTWEIDVVARIPWSAERQGGNCFLIDNKIYCVSSLSPEVMIYDLKTGTVSPQYYPAASSGGGIFSTVIGNEIWMFPIIASDKLIFFDVKKNEFHEVEQWTQWIEKEQIEGRVPLVAQDDLRLTLGVLGSNEMIETEYPFTVYKKIKVLGVEKTRCPIYIDKQLWASVEDEAKLIAVKDNKCVKYDIEENDYFWRAYNIGKRIYVITKNNLYVIEGEKAKKLWELKSEKENSGPPFFHYLETKQYVFFAPWNGCLDCIIRVDKQSQEIEEIKLGIEGWKIILKLESVSEEEGCNLTDFLKAVKVQEVSTIKEDLYK